MSEIESILRLVSSVFGIADSLGLTGPLIKGVLVFLASTWVFYLFYMVYCGYMVAVRDGARVRRLTRWMLYPAVAVGYLLDVLWNSVFGSLLFWQVPWYPGAGHPLKWTFTRRLRYWKDNAGWRGDQARWWATYLNPFDPGHV